MVYINLHIFISTVSPEGNLTATIDSYIHAVEMLTCGALGGPQNSFKWTKVESGLQVGLTAEINVTITSAFSGGEYECFVSNDAGNDSIRTIVNGEHYN